MRRVSFLALRSPRCAMDLSVGGEDFPYSKELLFAIYIYLLNSPSEIMVCAFFNSWNVAVSYSSALVKSFSPHQECVILLI